MCTADGACFRRMAVGGQDRTALTAIHTRSRELTTPILRGGSTVCLTGCGQGDLCGALTSAHMPMRIFHSRRPRGQVSNMPFTDQSGSAFLRLPAKRTRSVITIHTYVDCVTGQSCREGAKQGCGSEGMWDDICRGMGAERAGGFGEEFCHLELNARLKVRPRALLCRL